MSTTARPDARPPWWADLLVGVAVAALVAAAAYAAFTRLPLAYDGAYQLGWTLRAGEPFVYQSRFHTAVLWRPVAWLAGRTDDPRPLIAAFGGPFLLAPAVALLGSWWVVRRRRPGLIVWAAVGVATLLPGQAFVINDSLLQLHLVWPLLLGVLVGTTAPQKLFVAALAVFQIPHPVGAPLTAAAAGGAVALALVTGDRAERSRLLHDAVFVGAFCAAAAWKAWWTAQPGTPYYDAYVAHEADWSRVADKWYTSVTGWPPAALGCLFLAATLAAAHARLAGRPDAAAGGGRFSVAAASAVLAALGFAAALLLWSDDPRYWWGAVDYRRPAVVLVVPSMLLAWWELFAEARLARVAPPVVDRTPFDPDTDPDLAPPIAPLPRWPGLGVRVSVAAILCLAFAAVLSNQARRYTELSDRLMADVLAGPSAAYVVPPDDPSRRTPLHSWSMGWHALVVQGRSPTRWLLTPDFVEKPDQWRRAMAELDGPSPKLPVNDGGYGVDPAPGPTGWLDLRPLTARVVAERRAKAAWAEAGSPPTTQASHVP